ncbi:MAG: NADH-quinone oxidoreductase subunit L [Asgard group archaeon]|nr:NADH-quinone oxidoreductase subunit L [Asgard group archaeon]
MFSQYTPIINWAVPFAGAIITPIIGFIAGKIKEGKTQEVLYFIRNWFATFTAAISFIFSLSMVPDVFGGSGGETVWATWFSGLLDKNLNPMIVEFGTLVDPLSVMVACFASGVGLMIMIYGVGYMKGDKHLDRYWFEMQAFIGGMVLLVMSNNLFMTYVGWEIVGFCSYALIGYYFNKKEKQDPRELTLQEETEGDYNSHAGLKAFITTRIGDVMMLMGILIVFFYAGTFSYMDLLADLSWITALKNNNILILTAILIFGGPIGKSAQFPLQVWLPEAMAGPTTVSALIHAAAMVKAGVYMVTRTFPMWYLGLHDLGFENLKIYFLFVAAIGGFTAFMAATMGTASLELKKVLAFSTISQLGYMFMSLGVGGLIEPEAGVVDFNGFFGGTFHMLSHAMFKALLFLSAGAVLHAVHSKYMDRMGGLRKDMPKVFWPMLVGGLSLAGIPPLGGFFSKESIFATCHHLGSQGNPVGWIFLAVGAIAAVLTLFYTIRFLAFTFSGEKSENVLEVEEHQGGHLHKTHPTMWIPLILLAAGTIVSGFIGPFVEQFMSSNTWFSAATTFTVEEFHLNYGHYLAHTFGSWTFYGVTLGIIAVGGIPAYFLFVQRKWDLKKLKQENKFINGLYTILHRRWFINDFYYILLRGFKKFSELAYEYFDLRVIDQLNYIIASGTMKSGEVFRKTHTGVLSVNFIYLLFGIMAILIILLFAL